MGFTKTEILFDLIRLRLVKTRRWKMLNTPLTAVAAEFNCAYIRCVQIFDCVKCIHTFSSIRVDREFLGYVTF